MVEVVAYHGEHSDTYATGDQATFLMDEGMVWMIDIRCCCGKVTGISDPVILNNIVHEPLGQVGNFCGPKDKHTIRDQTNEITRLSTATAWQQEVIAEALSAMEDGDESGAYLILKNATRKQP